jgi:CBS-domain-containing membrane protein
MSFRQPICKCVTTCRMGDRLDTALGIMWEHDAGCLVVTTDEPPVRAIGIITDLRICAVIYGCRIDPSRLSVSDLMAVGVGSWKVRDALHERPILVDQGAPHSIPLMSEAGRLIGIISPPGTAVTSDSHTAAHASSVQGRKDTSPGDECRGQR